MQTQVCNKCKQEKAVELFSFIARKKGNNYRLNYCGDKRNVTCKDCCAEYARDFRKKNPGYKGSGIITKYPQEHRRIISLMRGRLSCHINSYSKYVKRNPNHPKPNIDLDYIYNLYLKNNGKCALSGITMTADKGSMLILSLDKIVPEKGYCKGNVQWVAWAVNRAKGEMSQQMFIDMCKKIVIKCNDYP